MKKSRTLVIICVVVVAFSLFVLFFGTHTPRGLGININDFSYSTTTNTTTTCPGVVNTIVGSTTSRTSFRISVITSATNTVTVCKDTACGLNASGIILAASTTPSYTQEDAYVGPYSCISSTASTTVGYSQSL